MTTTIRNEAAERLLHVALQHGVSLVDLMNEVLAFERRATVERIRERAYFSGWGQDLPVEGKRDPLYVQWTDLLAILDEEPAR